MPKALRSSLVLRVYAHPSASIETAFSEACDMAARLQLRYVEFRYVREQNLECRAYPGQFGQAYAPNSGRVVGTYTQGEYSAAVKP